MKLSHQLIASAIMALVPSFVSAQTIVPGVHGSDPAGYNTQVSQKTIIASLEVRIGDHLSGSGDWEFALLDNPTSYTALKTANFQWADNQAQTLSIAFPDLGVNSDTLSATLGGVTLSHDYGLSAYDIEGAIVWARGAGGEKASFSISQVNGAPVSFGALTDAGNEFFWRVIGFDGDVSSAAGGILLDWAVSSVTSGSDLAFGVDFYGTPVPEPSTVAGIGIGGIALIALLRRRRK